MRFTWTRYVRSLFLQRSVRSGKSPGRQPQLEHLEERLAPAGYFTWTGTGANANWSNPDNWADIDGLNVAPDGTGDILDFPNDPAAQRATVNDIVGGVFESIIVTGDNGLTSYTFSGETLTLGSAGTSGTIIAPTGNADFQLDIELGGASGDRRFFTVGAGANLTISGNLISDTNEAELAKDGVGTLILTNDNSGFLGPITVESNGGILRITHNKALGDSLAGTTISQNAQLQIDTVTGEIDEPLTLNGEGIASFDSALLNVAGNNTWVGNITMVSPTVALGANAGTTLTIKKNTTTNTGGKISDQTTSELIKRGAGTIEFGRDNDYDGLTTIENGILRIQNALSLGPSVGTAATGTVVLSNSNGVGSLQLDGPSGGGFVVFNELLTLNGNGNGIGALSNLRGNNTWAAAVSLASAVTIGAELDGATPTELTIAGVVRDTSTPVGLTKSRQGKLILNNSNTYAGATVVAQGVLNIRDSQGLGPAGGPGGTVVSSGASLELEVEHTDATKRYAPDPLGVGGKRDLWLDSITAFTGNGPQFGLRLTESLTISGTGVGGVGGALHSISGINRWLSPITLATGNAGIGVDPDPFGSNTSIYYTNDFSLTVGNRATPATSFLNDNASGTVLHKQGAGHLILPTANNYQGVTQIEQGWVTVEDTQSLGAFLTNQPDTRQPGTVVSDGAALHLKRRDTSQPFQFLENLVLDGLGVSHPFSLIDQKGALMSLGGVNTIGGPVNFGALGIHYSDIKLSGQAGIGVEAPFATDLVSELTITASVSETAPGGGITKLGSKRLILQGDGSYSGAVDIDEGILRVQHDSALGLASSGTSTGTQTYTETTTTIGTGIAEVQSVAISGAPTTYQLLLNGQPTVALNHNAPGSGGTLPADSVQNAINDLLVRLGISGTASVTQSGNVHAITFGGGLFGVNLPTLTFSSPGGVTATIATLVDGDGAAMELERSTTLNNGGISAGLGIWNEKLVLSGLGNIGQGLAPLTVLSSDHVWRGSLMFDTSAAIEIKPDARLTVLGAITDTNTPPPAGTNLILTGGTGIAEVQTVTVTGPQTGMPQPTFRLTFNGETTVPINANSDELVVQSALNALSTIGGVGGYVRVTRASNVYTVTFLGSLQGSNLSQLTATATDTTVSTGTTTQGSGGTGGKLILGGSSPAYRGSTLIHQGSLVLMHAQGLGTTGVSEVQTVNVTGTGNFTLSFNGVTIASPLSAASGNLANEIRDALNALSTILGVGGSVTVSATGSDYAISFGGNLRGFNQPQLVLASADPTALVTIVTTKDGSGGTVVSDGASLDLQGSLTVTGEPLILQGQGDASAAAGAAVAEMQTLSISTTSGTGNFTLRFNGSQASTVLNSGTVTATDIRNALIGLSTIGPEGGDVTVSGSGGLFTITFGGNLRGFNLPAITATPDAGTTVNVGTLVDGGAIAPGWFNIGPRPINNGQTLGSQAVAGRVTSVVVDPRDANVIYLTAAGGGAWRTVDGGKTWLPLFDSSPVQRIYLPGNTGTFTLTFNGVTTPTPLNLANLNTTLRQEIENALNALATIGGLTPIKGSVKVEQSTVNPLIFQVRFGDSLSGTTPPLIVATGDSTTSDPQVSATNPVMFASSIALDPNDSRIVYVGTGESTNGVPSNVSDAFYGTGIYKSVDSGKTWSPMLASDGSNPLQGLAITKILVDPGVDYSNPFPDTIPRGTPTGRLYVATSDQVINKPASSLLSLGILAGGTGYTANATIPLTFSGGGGGTGAAGYATTNASGSFTGIFLTSAGSGYTSPPSIGFAAGGGTGAKLAAYVTGTAGVFRFEESTGQVKTITVPALSGTGRFTLTYGVGAGNTTGPLNLNSPTLVSDIQTALNALTTITNVSASVSVTQSPLNPLVFTVAFKGGLLGTNVNNQTAVLTLSATGLSGSPAPLISNASTWVNLTGTATTARVTSSGQTGAAPNPNRAPGPNDDFRVDFQTSNVTWSDLTLAYIDPTEPPTIPAGLNPRVPILYAAMGTGTGNGFNAVFRTEEPNKAADNTIPTTWYIGDPGVLRNEIQELTIKPYDDGTLLYRLEFNGSSNRTPNVEPLVLHANDTEAVIKARLEALGSIGGLGGIVKVTKTAEDAITKERKFTIEFQGTLSNSDQPAITLVSASNGLTVTLATLQQGSGVDNRSGVFPFGSNGNIKLTSFTSTNGVFNPIYTNVTLYALVANGIPNSTYRTLQKSTNGGKSWSTATATGLAGFTPGQGYYNLAVVTNDGNTVYVGGQESSSTTHVNHIFVSTDGGGSFTDISTDTTNNRSPHTSTHALVIDGSGNLLAGTDGGIWRRSGTTWTDINGNLAITQFNDIAGHPSSLNTVYGGTRLNGTVAFGGNLNWTVTGNAAAREWDDGGQFIVDPTNPQILYHIQGQNFFPLTSPTAILRKSTNGGTSWSTILNPINFTRYPSFVIDPLNTQRLLVGGISPDTTLRESTNGGATWNSRSAPISVTALAIGTYQGPFQSDPFFDSVATPVVDKGSSAPATSTIYITDGSSVRVTKNNGSNWSNNRAPTLPGFAGPIVDIQVDPANRDIAYLVTGGFGKGKLYKTIDAGVTWVSVNGDNFSFSFPNAGTPFAVTIDTTNLTGLPNRSATLTNSNGQFTISFSGVTGGTFTLSHNGLTTAAITWTSNQATLSANIKAALDALFATTTSATAVASVTFPSAQTQMTAHRNGEVLLVRLDTGGAGYTVSTTLPLVFTGGGGTGAAGTATTDATGAIVSVNLTSGGSGYTSAPAISVAGGTTAATFTGFIAGILTGTSPTVTVTGTGTSQTVTFGGAITGGTFTLVIPPRSATSISTPIAWSNDPVTLAANIQAALDVLVTGTTVVSEGRVVVTFNRPGPVGPMTVDITGLTAGPGLAPDAQVVETTGGSTTPTNVQEVQTITFTGDITGGSFTITLNGATTTPIPWTLNPTLLAQTIQNAVNQLFVAQVGVTSSSLPDVPTWKVVVDPRNGDLYVGNDNGVYRSTDGGSQWARFGIGMPNTQVKDLELNLTNNTLVAGTYGRSVYQLFLDDARPNAGALRAISGNSVWNGTIQLVGDPITNRVTIAANGTQSLQNGVATAQLTIGGTIVDRTPTPGSDPRLIKTGQGDVILTGVNLYGGVTEIDEGVLVVKNARALGKHDVPGFPALAANTIVNPGTALHLAANLELEPILLFGDGIQPPVNGHNTGALRNVTGNNTYTGVLTLGSNATIGVDPNQSLTIGAKAGLLGEGSIDDGAGAFDLIKELAGRLTLASANTYDGDTNIHQGAVQISHALALGTTLGQTNVFDGGQLQVQSPTTGPLANQPVIVDGELLTLSGSGILGTGAVLNTGGDNIWRGPVTLVSNPVLLLPTNAPATTPPSDVSFGANDGTSLTIDGPIEDPFSLANTGGVPGTEAEGNNTFATANPITLPGSNKLVLSGGIGTSADQDWFVFTLTTRSGVFFDIDSRETGLSTTLNSVLTLYASNGTTVLDSNDNGYDFDTGYPAPSSVSATSADSALYRDLDPGTYYIRVSSTGGTSGNYVLDVRADTDYSNTIPVLNSNPGAPATLFLDFDGHADTDSWGTYNLPGFNFAGGSAAELTPGEKLAIRNIWRVVSEDYSPFKINISTNYAGPFTDGVAQRMVYTTNDGSGVGATGALGVAFLNSFAFGGTSNQVSWVFAANFSQSFGDGGGGSGQIMATPVEQGNTSSHEFGHALGLQHYATSTGSAGLAEVIPGAIMATPDTGLSREIWAAGISEPGTAQDDMAVISNGTNAFGYRPDDHGNTTGSATLLNASGNTFTGVGIISEIATDVDYFSFVAVGGATTIQGIVDDYLNDLDVTIRVFNSLGVLIGQDDPAGSFDASVTLTLTAGETYYVEVGTDGEDGEAGQYVVFIGPPGSSPTGGPGGLQSFGLLKVGLGKIILQQANGYGGLTTVAEGILNIQDGDALGATTTGTVVLAGAALEVDGDPAATGIDFISVPEPLTLNGTGFDLTGALRNLSGDNTWSGNVILASNSSIGTDPDTLLTITGSVRDPLPTPVPAASLTKVGTGTLSFTTQNTYSGETFVNSGILNLQNGDALGAGLAEQQTVIVSGAGGTFTLTFLGKTTVALDILDPNLGANIQAALNALTTIGAGGVTVSPLNGLPASSIFTITFAGGLAQFNQPEIVSNPSPGVTAQVDTVRDGPEGTVVNPTVVQTFTVNDLGMGGTFNLTFNGQTTVDLPFDVPASGGLLPTSSVENALLALSSISGVGGSVVVTQVGNVYTVVFDGSLAQSFLAPITGSGLNGTSVDGISSPGATLQLEGAITVDTEILTLYGQGFGDLGALHNLEDVNIWRQPTAIPAGFNPTIIQTVTVTGTTGTFNLTFGGQTTVDLPFDVPATGGSNPVDSLQNALNALTSISGSGSFVVVTQVGSAYTIVFEGPLASTFLDTITATGLGGATVDVTLTRATLQLKGDTFLGSASGSVEIEEAILEAGGSFDVTKVGLGTVIYSGEAGLHNNYTGLTQVNEGTLVLDKDPGADTFRGDLQIGDAPTGGPANSAIVRLAQDNEILDTALTTILSDGWLDLATFDDVIDDVVVADGHVSAGVGGSLTIDDSLDMDGGSIDLGGTGDQLLFGTSPTLSITSSADETAVISGTGNIALGMATQTVDVPDGPQDVDLQVGAPFSGTAAARLIKTGAGFVVVDVASDSTGTLAGVVEVKSGTVQVDGKLNQVELTNATATLAGIGTVGSITGGGVNPAVGTVAPGDSGTGTLNGTSALWGSGTNYSVEVTHSSGNDKLLLTGDITITDANLIILPDAAVVPGDSFIIIETTGGKVTGQFIQGVKTFVNGKKFTIEYKDSDSDTFVDQVILNRVKADVVMTITSSANPSVYGEELTYTVTVVAEAGSDPIPTDAQVTFTVDSTTSASVDVGTGTLEFDPQLLIGGPLSVGTHLVSATFLDHPDFNTNTIDLDPDQVVNRAEVTIGFSTSPTNPFFGQDVTLQIDITAVAPGGEVTGSLLPEGTVTITINAGQPSEEVHVVNVDLGVAQLLKSGLPVGTYTVSVAYSGDTNYLDETTTTDFTFEVTKPATGVEITPNVPTIARGESVTFTAEVVVLPPGSGLPTGTVDFFYDFDSDIAGATQFADDLPLDGSAMAQVPTTGLPAGTLTIFAVYSGDASFLGSTGMITYVVTPAATTTTLTSTWSTSPTLPVFGQSVTFTAEVTADIVANGIPVGEVIFTVGGVPQTPVPLDGTGKASISVSSLAVGSTTVTADFVDPTTPDANDQWAASSDSMSQDVTKANSATSLSSGTNPSVAGNNVTFTATVSAVSPGGNTPNDGIVTFFVDGVNQGTAPVVAGVATRAILFSMAGTFEVTATYSGSGSYNDSTTTSATDVSQVVQSPTTVVITPSPLSTARGDLATFTAQVTATAPLASGVTLSGTVDFFWDVDTTFAGATQFADDVPLNGLGQAVGTISTLAAGSYTIFAVYNGATHFLGQMGTRAYLVTPAATTTNVTSSKPVSSVFGESVTFTAEVTANVAANGTPVGQVIFTVDGVAQPAMNLVAGKASIVVSNLGVGNRSIRADFIDPTTPNSLDQWATSNDTHVQQVLKANSLTTLVSQTNPSLVGDAVNFTATITPVSPSGATPNDGLVTFFVNGVAVPGSVSVVGGVANKSITFSTVGTFSVTASYTGSANFNNSTSTTGPTRPAVQQKVVRNSTTEILAEASPVFPATTSKTGQMVVFYARVTPASGAIPTGMVQFKIDGMLLATKALVAYPVGSPHRGKAYAAFAISTMAVGDRNIEAVYLGNTTLKSSTDTQTFTVEKADTGITLVSSTGGTVHPNPAPSLNPAARATTFGNSVTFTAFVNPIAPGKGLPNGTVVFRVNGNDLAPIAVNAQGFARITLTASTLTVGTHTVTATFTPGTPSNFNGSTTRAALTQVVNPAPLPTSLAISKLTTAPDGTFPIQLYAVTPQGQQAFGYNSQVELLIQGAPAGGTLQGPLTGTFVNGYLVISGLSATKSGNYSIRARSVRPDGVTLVSNLITFFVFGRA